MKKRNIFTLIESHIPKKEFTILIGARQTGKTTLLQQVFNNLKKQNKKVWFITFEKEDILKSINNDPENIFQYILRPNLPLNNNDNERIYLLIDEIQYANNPSNFLKYLYDTYQPHLKIIATGSSSFYIDKKFTDSLAGRKAIFNINTLNFEEFLHFKERDELLDEFKLIKKIHDYKSLKYLEIMQQFSDYLTFGGYPDVVLSSTKREKIDKLTELKNSFIRRDINESRVENEQLFYNLMSLLAAQSGSLLNKYSISKTLRCDISTIERYLNVLQKCFHISLVKPFYSNLKKEIVKMPKVYMNDLGLRNLLLNNFIDIEYRLDRGELLENYVFLRFREMYYESSIHFWRTTGLNEVDFVIDDQIEGKKAFQVKFSPDRIRYSKYKIFKNTYPEYPLSFIGYNFSDAKDVLPVLKI